MVLCKVLSLAVFLLLASTFQVWGQPACTSHLLPNSTVDFDQYNNTGLLVIQTLMTDGQTGMTDCSLRCCETENCSLVIFNKDENNSCLMIHCISDDACNPIPSNSSQWIRSIRNNGTAVANTLILNNTSTEAENTSASNSTDMTGNTTLNTPSVQPTSTTTLLPANTSVSAVENTTELSQSLNSSAPLMNSSSNATDMASNDTVMPTAISSDNVTEENTTGLNSSDVQILKPSNTTSLNESLGTSDNVTGVISSNDTNESGEPVTESVLLPISSPGPNTTSSLENGTISVSQNSSLTTEVPAVVIDSNSTWPNSTNGTLPSFNGSGNNTAAEEADSMEGGAPIAGDQSMMVVLVATLSVGMLLFIAIVAVVSKKAVDGWQRRHYSRIDYLVNGMYN